MSSGREISDSLPLLVHHDGLVLRALLDELPVPHLITAVVCRVAYCARWSGA